MQQAVIRNFALLPKRKHSRNNMGFSTHQTFNAPWWQ